MDAEVNQNPEEDIKLNLEIVCYFKKKETIVRQVTARPDKRQQ